jgi:hypothetical protein
MGTPGLVLEKPWALLLVDVKNGVADVQNATSGLE